jgi:hypothetical protein
MGGPSLQHHWLAVAPLPVLHHVVASAFLPVPRLTEAERPIRHMYSMTIRPSSAGSKICLVRLNVGGLRASGQHPMVAKTAGGT